MYKDIEVSPNAVGHAKHETYTECDDAWGYPHWLARKPDCSLGSPNLVMPLVSCSSIPNAYDGEECEFDTD